MTISNVLPVTVDFLPTTAISNTLPVEVDFIPATAISNTLFIEVDFIPVSPPPGSGAEDEVAVSPSFEGEPLRSVIFGEVPAVAEDALNLLTAEQFKFIADRQRGAGGVELPINSGLGRYTGPAYPFGPSWAQTLGPKTDLEVIFTSIVNILTTTLRTLPYRPDGGSEIPNLVFEPNDAITRGLIRYFVQRDLDRQEPRAEVEVVRTVVPENEPHTVVVTVAFRITGDPEDRVFSAPVEFNTLSIAA